MTKGVSNTRMPVEKWSRPELEDKVHSLNNNNIKIATRNAKLEKDLKIINGRLRRALLSGVDNRDEQAQAQNQELQRQNHLLNQRIKTLKHQLLTYTKPSSQHATVNFLTSRHTTRPQSSHFTVHNTQNNAGTSRETSNVVTKPETTVKPNVVHEEVVVKRQTLEDKTMLIKLNKELREAMETAEIQTFEAEKQMKLVERLKQTNHQLTNDLNETRNSLKELQDTLNSLRSQSMKSDEISQSSLQIHEQELRQLNEEVRMLKEVNNKLIEGSLNVNLPDDRNEVTSAKTRVFELESTVRSLENEKKHTKRRYDSLKEKYNKVVVSYKTIKARSRTEQNFEVPKSNSNNNSDIDEEVKKKNQHVLNKLFDDVVSIVDSHMPLEESKSLFTSEQKWQQLYEQMYLELEKVRNLLVVEVEMNKDLKKQLDNVTNELSQTRNVHRIEHHKYKDQVEDLQKQVEVLENHLKAVSGGDITVIESKPMAPVPQQELKFYITQVKVNVDSRSLEAPSAPRFFICCEFFDFEISLTEIFSGLDSNLNFSSTYELVVSDLLIHFMETEGITLELFESNGLLFNSLGNGQIKLSQYLGPKSFYEMNDTVDIVNDKNNVIAKVSYQLRMPEKLSEALKEQKKREVAATYLQLDEEEVDEDTVNELMITVIKCNNLNVLISSPSFVYYQLFDFYPHKSGTVLGTDPMFNDAVSFPLILSEELDKTLKSGYLNIFLLEHSKTMADFKPGTRGIVTVTVPLYSLSENKVIKRTFALKNSNGEVTDATITVDIHWKKDYGFKSVLDGLVEETKDQSEFGLTEIDESDEDNDDQNEKEDTGSDEKSSSRHSTIQEDEDAIILESPKSPPSPPLPRIGVDPVALTRRLSLETSKLPETIDEEQDEEGSQGSARSDATYVASDRKTEGEENHLEEELVEVPEDKEDLLEVPLGREMNLRSIEFTEPMHLSIPPSETSSVSEDFTRPKPVKRVSKTEPDLERIAGRSNLRLVPRKDKVPDFSEPPIDAKVEFKIETLKILEDSFLLGQEYDHTNISIEWIFLDFDRNDCKTPFSVPMPRNVGESADFFSEHTYELDWRRIGLLRQWMSLGIKLRFVLVLEGHERDEIDLIGEALFDLQDVIVSNKHTVQILDMGMDPLAELYVEINYTDQLWQYFPMLVETK